MVLPADWEASESLFKYPIAAKVGENGEVVIVRPVYRELSRSGLAGMWYYDFSNVDVVIYLNQSCDIQGRHRWIYRRWCGLTPEKCDMIDAAVANAWRKGGGVDDVEKVLSGLRLA
jgi:hypothetical protein